MREYFIFRRRNFRYSYMRSLRQGIVRTTTAKKKFSHIDSVSRLSDSQIDKLYERNFHWEQVENSHHHSSRNTRNWKANLFILNNNRQHSRIKYKPKGMERWKTKVKVPYLGWIRWSKSMVDRLSRNGESWYWGGLKIPPYHSALDIR